MNKILHTEDKIFTGERLRLWGWSGFILFCLIMSWVALIRPALRHTNPWPILADGYPLCIDFGFFWLSGKLAVSGDTAQIFDFPAWSAVQSAFFDPGSCPNFNRFYYPPTLLFLTYPLGLMSYVVALCAWVIASFALYQATVYAIIPRREALLAAATPLVMFANVFLGHTGFFTAAFMGLSLVFMERRPWLAGIFLALLTYKPHFGVLFPIALLASRNWRVFGTTILATAVLVVFASMAFGFEGWVQFIDSLTDRNSGLGPAPEVIPKLQSIFGLFRSGGAGTTVSWGGQLVVAGIVMLGIWMIWAKPISFNLKAAALCAGTLLVVPYSILYDLTMLSIAAAFFVKEGLLRGFLPGERTLILISWLFLLFTWFRLGPGPEVSIVLLVLVVRRLVSDSLTLEHVLNVSISVPAS